MSVFLVLKKPCPIPMGYLVVPLSRVLRRLVDPYCEYRPRRIERIPFQLFLIFRKVTLSPADNAYLGHSSVRFAVNCGDQIAIAYRCHSDRRLDLGAIFDLG